jgi:REP element-mobilizing transposase RayT
MANTYTQCYFHLVFAIKNRDALIKKAWKDELGKYITGIVQNHRHKMLAIGSMPDHLHILIGYNLNQLIPDLVEEIKTSTNSWIKGKRLSKFKFEWQKGYGAFTHSHSQIDLVAKYILSQEEHHKKGHSEKNILKFRRRTTWNLKMNMSLNSLMTLMVGIKYYGALHLY